MSTEGFFLVAVIGAGPAGLFAAQYLARQGVHLVVFNRDIKPGGLAEYAIFPAKQKMRKGLEAQFKRILNMPNVVYQGNVTIGQTGDIRLDQLRKIGFQAFVVTTGAQHSKWLGLPGEDLAGVYQANDMVLHYNRFPERAGMHFDIGKKIAIIGVGNVMLDILHYLKESPEKRQVIAYARRSPSEVRFDKPTLEPVVDCFNLEAVKEAAEGTAQIVQEVGQDISGFCLLLENARERAEPCESGLSVEIKFLLTPRRLIGDEKGRLKAIVFEKNHLVKDSDEILPNGTGLMETFPADTVIFSIGSSVDTGFGLPVERGHFVTSPNPRFPVDGISYEVYNPDLCATCEDIFVGGWARLASAGVVGLARKDAERCARAVMAYLNTLSPHSGIKEGDILRQLPELDKKIVNQDDLEKLMKAEQEYAARMGLDSYKFDSNDAMLRAIAGPLASSMGSG